MTCTSFYEWHLGSFLYEESKQRQYALVVLNQPIDHENIFEKAWKNATLKLCADGGANRLYEFTEKVILRDVEKEDEIRSYYLPDEIRGDFDSLLNSIRTYYSKKGVKMTHDKDQDSTDFGKCLNSIHSNSNSNLNSIMDILVVGSLSGRFDQTMSIIHHLYLNSNSNSNSDSDSDSGRTCIILTSHNLVCLLNQGKHVLKVHHIQGLTCGIMPIGNEARVTTRGLRWNLNDTLTTFGGLISTSNEIIGIEGSQDDRGFIKVEIETSAPIIWCEELVLDNVRVDSNELLK